MKLRYLPALILLLFVGIAVWRLAIPENRDVASKMVGRPVPAFIAPAALAGRTGVSARDLADGQPHLVNFFASWCVPCIGEAPVLAELKRRGVAIDGIAVRDSESELTRFLAQYGDPYTRLGDDPDSRVQLAWGSSGVPETFLVDRGGVIRFQKIGPVGPGDVDALVRAWEAAK